MLQVGATGSTEVATDQRPGRIVVGAVAMTLAITERTKAVAVRVVLDFVV